jgi:hypothetical protein
MYLSLNRGDGLIDFLRTVGRNLVSLELGKISVEVVDAIVDNCPNLQYLEVLVDEEDLVEQYFVVRRGGCCDMWEEGGLAEMKQALKVGLKRLAKLKVNDAPVRLGTDWAGYPEVEVEVVEFL